MNLSLLAGIVVLLLWVVLAFVVRVPHGWPHLLLGLGVILLIRRVVTGRDAW